VNGSLWNTPWPMLVSGKADVPAIEGCARISSTCAAAPSFTMYMSWLVRSNFLLSFRRLHDFSTKALVTFGAAGIGALAGSIIGTLVSIGVPEEEAHHYQRELEKGHTIVTVKAQSGYDDVIAIMRGNGAIDAQIRYSEFNAQPPLRPYSSTNPPEDE
jgi:hypothetical protein